MPGKSIILIGNFLSASGGKRSVCEDLADRLARSGWRVLSASNREGRFEKIADMLLTVWKERRNYSVAHVDVFSGKAFFWAEAVCAVLKAIGRPYVLTLHGGALPVFAQRWPGRVNRLLQSAAAVTAPSDYLRSSFVAIRPDLRIIPNALSLADYPFRCRARPSARLVWIRSFHEMYNPVMAVDTVDRLRGLWPDTTLTMIGPDRGDGSLDRTVQRIKHLGLEKHVEIISGVPKSQIPHHLSQADIFLNTSSIDNTPVSVLEAMACGLCVISTDAGGLRHILHHDVDSLMVPCSDTQAMVDSVQRVLTSPDLGERLSTAARRAATELDWTVVLQKWQSLLASVSDKPAA